jgi:hypothetical protein
MPEDRWLAAIPGLFVLLWRTGFIGAKLGTPFAPPFTLLLLRFVVVGIGGVDRATLVTWG